MDPQIGKKYTIEEILAMGYEEGMSARFVKTPCLRPLDGRAVEHYFIQNGGIYKIIEPTPQNILFQ